jgi:DNA-binding response OmpR family regulator
VISNEKLIEKLCSWDEEISSNAIEVYVHRLRKKLHPLGVNIITVRGLGYMLEKKND